MFTRTDAAKVSESGDDADCSMAAHPEETDIVKENGAGGARGVGWQQEQCTDHDVGAARFVNNCRAKPVVLFTKNLQPLGNATIAQVRASIDDDAGRFPSRMRVNDTNSLHGHVDFRWL
jgi:hypothetical protein